MFKQKRNGKLSELSFSSALALCTPQNALKHFDPIAQAVVAACGDLPIQAEVKERFEVFKDLASKTYALMKMIKSQDMLNPDEFNCTPLHFILA